MLNEWHLPSGLSYQADGTLGDLCIIIDMQNVYLPNQPWACRETLKVGEQIESMITLHAADNFIFTRFIAPSQPKGTWTNYNQAYSEINGNAWMNAIIDPLQPYTKRYPVYDKSTYSSYYQTDVKTLCSLANRIVLTGVVAECCVLATAFSLIDAGHPLIYLKDAVTGTSVASELAVEQFVDSFSPIHTQVMTVEDYKKGRLLH